MTKVRMADVAKECATRLLNEGRELPLDAAKNSVRLCFDDMESELKRRLLAEHASREQRSQFRDAFEALRASVVGMLQSVAVRVAQPQYADPRARDRDYAEWRQQEQRGTGGPFGGFIDKVFGPPADPHGYPPPEPPRAASILIVKTDTVYQQVLSACALLDKVLTAAEPREEAPVVPWAQTNEFLTEAQKLFAAHMRGNGQRALAELGLLEERLKARYGVEVIRADDSNRRDFEVWSNELPGDGSFETTLPAIAVHGRTMLRGEALGPAMTPPAGQAKPESTDPVQPPASAGGGVIDGEG
jgi:hypothetical protein